MYGGKDDIITRRIDPLVYRNGISNTGEIPLFSGSAESFFMQGPFLFPINPNYAPADVGRILFRSLRSLSDQSYYRAMRLFGEGREYLSFLGSREGHPRYSLLLPLRSSRMGLNFTEFLVRLNRARIERKFADGIGSVPDRFKYALLGTAYCSSRKKPCRPRLIEEGN